MLRDQLHIVFFMIPAVIQGTPLSVAFVRSLTCPSSAKVSIDRVSEFLQKVMPLSFRSDGLLTSQKTELLDEFEESEKSEHTDIIVKGPKNQNAIGFNNATFAWSSDVNGSLTPSRREFRLRIEDELVFKRGCFNLIVGPTGSGKTSLLMALLGKQDSLNND